MNIKDKNMLERSSAPSLALCHQLLASQVPVITIRKLLVSSNLSCLLLAVVSMQAFGDGEVTTSLISCKVFARDHVGA